MTFLERIPLIKDIKMGVASPERYRFSYNHSSELGKVTNNSTESEMVSGSG